MLISQTRDAATYRAVPSYKRRRVDYRCSFPGYAVSVFPGIPGKLAFLRLQEIGRESRGLGQCISLIPVLTAISVCSYMHMRQRKTRLDKKKGYQPTPQCRKRFVVSYHLIGQPRGWVKTQIQTNHTKVFLTITQWVFKTNIEHVFLVDATI
jgi:hypothetical protein